MKKVDKPSDLYTSRGRTAHVNINREPKLESMVCVPHPVTWRRSRQPFLPKNDM